MPTSRKYCTRNSINADGADGVDGTWAEARENPKAQIKTVRARDLLACIRKSGRLCIITSFIVERCAEGGSSPALASKSETLNHRLCSRVCSRANEKFVCVSFVRDAVRTTS